MFVRLKNRIDFLCDYTYNFTWQNNRIRPENIIPSQEDSNYTYSDLVNELKKGGEVHISGSAGKGLGYSMGVDLKHFGGKGDIEKAGKIYVEGNVSSEMGMGMVSGIIYVTGIVEQPYGNVIEVKSDEKGYRKFRSITDFLCNGAGKDEIIENQYDEKKRYLHLIDGIQRGTVGARCNCQGSIAVEGDVFNGTGILMQKGMVHVTGDAAMNTGAHLDGGLVIIEGEASEFAGAYMKKGTIVLRNAKDFAGANMKSGVILSKNKLRVISPVTELTTTPEEVKLLMNNLGIGHVEALSYHKYGIMTEKLIRMRDGSVVVKKIYDDR